jgi:hypothetical protein
MPPKLCTLGELGGVKEHINEYVNDADAESHVFLFPDVEHAKPQQQRSQMLRGEKFPSVTFLRFKAKETYTSLQ